MLRCWAWLPSSSTSDANTRAREYKLRYDPEEGVIYKLDVNPWEPDFLLVKDIQRIQTNKLICCWIQSGMHLQHLLQSILCTVHHSVHCTAFVWQTKHTCPRDSLQICWLCPNRLELTILSTICTQIGGRVFTELTWTKYLLDTVVYWTICLWFKEVNIWISNNQGHQKQFIHFQLNGKFES